MSALERVFHGWDSAFLPKFTQGLLAQHGPNLGEFTIALPGRRAGRRLLELLVAEAPPAWTPPRILTLAQLSDQLTRWPLPRADDSLRELACSLVTAAWAWESSLAFSRDMARALFLCCERSSWHSTTIPLLRWVMRTAESVLLTC